MSWRWFFLLLVLPWAGCDARGGADNRQEVVFWHFWGGRDRPVVEEIVQRFNNSQTDYRVRAVAMPGTNLDLKFFLSIAGGDPPDLINQDDPIVADWASRGALVPLDELVSLDELAPAEEIARLNDWLFPAARQLASYNDHLYALPNGLDIRALYVNQTLLEEHGLPVPRTTEQLDQIATTIAPPGAKLERVGYLPDPRRLWAWAIVFGGQFYNPAATTPEAMITADCPENLTALRWMAQATERYGADAVTAFRTGDQGLTGAAFPLLADRRYAAMMDGQWRVRDIAESNSTDEFIVTPLPAPPGGRANAGWVNGNFFVVPRGAKQSAGAWEFMKFWAGFDGNASEAARACAAGGWIPVSQQVVDEPAFQTFLAERPLFRPFVELAASENQIPTPPLPIASFYYREINNAVQDVMYRGEDAEARLKMAADRVREQLKRTREGE